MIETHPFGVFAPPKVKYLLLGSFIAIKRSGDDSYDWFYGSKRNQFWPIIEEVYKVKLSNKKAKQDLFSRLSIAIADIIHQCERKDNNSLDSNLTNAVYNSDAINRLLGENPIERILFSSRFVEKEFRKHFKKLIEKYPDIELVTLPSPSPRYAAMSREEKVKRYSRVFPKLERWVSGEVKLKRVLPKLRRGTRR